MKKTKKLPKKSTIHHKVQRSVKLAVVPHGANQYRPHLVRWYGVAALLILAAFAFCVTNLYATGQVLGVSSPITTTELLQDTNKQRYQNNQPGFNYNDELSRAAFLKAQDMFKQQYWAHTAPDGTTPWSWFAKVKYNYAYAGENLAKNFKSADATVAAWMASTHHRENILNTKYTDVGFAVVEGVLNGKVATIVVALYGAPASSVAGVATGTVTTAAPSGSFGLVARIGVALQSMSPAVLGSIVMLTIGSLVALTAHAYRRRLPLALRRSWRYHHGLYKSAGLIAVVFMFVTLYSGGQI